MIPYGRQDITQEDIDAVVEVLKSDFLTQGPVVPRFEEAVAEYVGAKYGVAVNSATSALHIACLALGLGPGDFLWTTPITFVASANCGLYCGAQVDFVDIDPHTYNMCPAALEAKLEEAKRNGRLPKVLIPVHMCGQSCDMFAIHGLARKYGFRVIEDASHAVGGKYRNEYIGDCRFSDITVFSFHPVKIITTGEGGVATTNDETLAARLGLFRSHGITRDPRFMFREPEGTWYYEQIDLGYNYRMTEMQAALGLSQLRRLEEYVACRHELASRFDTLLAGLPVSKPRRSPDTYSAWHLYVIRVNVSRCGRTRQEVFEHMRGRDIGVNLHYIPVHTQPYYTRMGFSPEDYPRSLEFYREAITLPLHQSLTFAEQDRVHAALLEALAL